MGTSIGAGNEDGSFYRGFCGVATRSGAGSEGAKNAEVAPVVEP